MNEQKPRSLLQDKLNAFYVSAFAPLIPLLIYRYAAFNDPLGTMIPLYGFLILFIKKDKLTEYTSNTNRIQRALGLALVVTSFFAYYAIAPFIPNVGIYGIVNYTIYLFGLVLLFFTPKALKQTFSAFFLIIASAITGLSFRWIEHQITPTAPYYVSVFSIVLNAFGIRHTRPSPDTLFLFTTRGIQPVWFEGGCLGVYSLIIFSILIVVTMVETSASRRTKIAWSIIGLLGIFALNVIRLIIVLASMYLYGYAFGQQVHQVIGYVLFMSWLVLFLYLFSQRQAIAHIPRTIQRKIQALT